MTRLELLDALREHLHRSGDRPITFVLQDSAEEGAWRPGGTGHAIVAAADVLDDAFAVANGDDFYGAAAWTDLIAFLRDGPASHAALVGYPLADTLSPSGGVSRALCEVQSGGEVVSIVEWKDVRDTGSTIAGVDLAGRPAHLDGAAFASMNLWGLRPDILPALRSQSKADGSGHAGGEFLLSSAMDALLHQGRVAVRLLPSRSSWFGLTHPADLPTVQTRLRRMTDAGAYSLPLHFPRTP